MGLYQKPKRCGVNKCSKTVFFCFRAQEVMDSKFERVKTDESEAEFGPEEKCRIWKNVLIIGFAFMIHFTAFWGASNLQSSVNSEAALGTFTLAAIYASLILSNIFLPALVIR